MPVLGSTKYNFEMAYKQYRRLNSPKKISAKLAFYARYLLVLYQAVRRIKPIWVTAAPISHRLLTHTYRNYATKKEATNCHY